MSDAPVGFEHFFTSSYGIHHSRRVNGDGSVSYAASQDVEAILDHNKKLATENDGWNKTRDMRRVASIPIMLLMKWQAEEGWDAFDPHNADRLAKKLNDPDYAHLRTAPGRIGYTNGVMR
ncbi:hypothetical protein [Caulobacter sp. NIBR2454]|uniref:hypothetical protein n=1 Tax=Caulobacter sp. NIBR2454 TaxID=3015996 RepID=UPI0022B6FB0E|nr:hypothetical protein [Caulobacter sp. NIBR2454]